MGGKNHFQTKCADTFIQIKKSNLFLYALAHLPDFLRDFSLQPIDVPIVDRSLPSAAAAPVTPCRRNRTKSRTPLRHQLRRAALPVVVVFSKSGDHRSALDIDV